MTVRQAFANICRWGGRIFVFLTSVLKIFFTLTVVFFLLSYKVIASAYEKINVLRFTAFATLFLALATAVLALVAYRQTNIMENDQRAWVSASNIRVGEVKWKDGEARFTVLINLKNTGHSPGLSVDVRVAAYPFLDLYKIIEKQQKEMSETERHHPSTMGTMVFPGDDIPQAYNIPLSRDEIEKFQQEIRTTSKNTAPVTVTFVPTVILIIIDYRFAEKSDHHQTGYMLNLQWRDPERPDLFSLALPIGIDIPAENLRLQYQILGQYAD